MSVLKELPTLEGRVEVKGRIAYVAQQPWVFSASLRQNIVFGNKFDKVKYDRILKACALNKVISFFFFCILVNPLLQRIDTNLDASTTDSFS